IDFEAVAFALDELLDGAIALCRQAAAHRRISPVENLLPLRLALAPLALLDVIEAFHQIELVAMSPQRRPRREEQREHRPNGDHLGEDAEVPRHAARERRE